LDKVSKKTLFQELPPQEWCASAHLFVTLTEGTYVLWDYLNKRKFAIDATTLNRLRQWTDKTNISALTELDVDLLMKGLIGPLEDEKKQFEDWEWDLTSYIFHIGTRYDLKDEDIPDPEQFTGELITNLQSLDISGLEPYSRRRGQRIELPEIQVSRLQQCGFWDILKRRKTCREFYNNPIDLQDLSNLLFATFGRVHKTEDDTDTGWRESGVPMEHFGYRRTSASGGSLQVIEAYVVASNVSGLAEGIYHYNSLDNSLVQIRQEHTRKPMVGLLAGQYFGDGAALGIFLTARFDRAWWRYKVSRGYRVALLDAGHLSQTFQLVATTLNLNTWVTAAFLDGAIEEYLELDTPREAPIMYLCAGPGTGSAFNWLHRKMANSL
jgi:SagB-type dehydrogenase family enzyme